MNNITSAVLSPESVPEKAQQARQQVSPRQRVVFCTYPSVYSDIVLEELLKAEPVDLVGVVVSNRVLRKNSNPLRAVWQQIRLSGLHYATYLFVITRLYSLLQRLMGRQLSLHRRLQHKGIPVLQTQDINAPASVSFLQQQQADILLSAHFNQLIKAPVLGLAELHCLNLHPSLLPAYKGVDPAFYALLRREQSSGASIHFLNEAFDSGEILDQQRLQIRWHDSLFSLNTKLFKLGALSAVAQIKALAAPDQGQLAVKAQTEAGCYDSWPDPQQVRQFRQHRKLLRWKEYLRFIRRPASGG